MKKLFLHGCFWALVGCQTTQEDVAVDFANVPAEDGNNFSQEYVDIMDSPESGLEIVDDPDSTLAVDDTFVPAEPSSNLEVESVEQEGTVDPVEMAPEPFVDQVLNQGSQDRSDLRFVGYDYRPEEKLLSIDFVHRNFPEIYVRFDEIAQAMIVTMRQTTVEKPVSYALDSSEFVAPVSKIMLMRNGQNVEVKLDLREPESVPRVRQVANGFQLEFDLDERYLSPYEVPALEPIFKAEKLTSLSDKQYEIVAERSYRHVAQDSIEDTVVIDDSFVSHFDGEKIDLSFSNANLSEILRVISDRIGINFVYPDAIGGRKVTIKLAQVPWDAALQAILENHLLGLLRVSDNIYRIDTLDQLYSYAEKKRKNNLERLLAEPKKILVIKMSHQKADSGFVGQVQSFLSVEGMEKAVSVNSDERTNTLLIEGPPGLLDKAKKLVERLDQPLPQVEIEARLIQVSRSNALDLGVAWNSDVNYDANRGLGFGTLNFPNSLSSDLTVDPGVFARTGDFNGRFRVNIGSINNFTNIDLILGLAKSKNLAETLQTSKVIVADGVQANISSGTEAYFRNTVTSVNAEEGATTNASSLQSVSFSLDFGVTPKVANDGTITLEISINNSTPVAQSVTGSDVTSSTQSLTTTLRKKDGETTVIGGMYEKTEVKRTIGIPFFMDLPIIGPLFQSNKYDESEKELMLLITPRLVKHTESEESQEVKYTEFDSQDSYDF